MTFEISLFIGLLLGAIYALTRRVVTASRTEIGGGPVLLKWPHGIGRASVIDFRSGVLHLSQPVMRESYAPPEPGSEVVLKPLSGGPARRAKFVAERDDCWECRV